MRRPPTVLPIAVLLALPGLPGCIAWEIRDEVRGVNARLETVEEALVAVNADLTDIEVQLTEVNSIISETNQHLAVVQGDLGTTKSSLGSVDTSLGSVDEQLQLLREIQGSLSRLDTHLGSLRKTINRIDGAIPFLSLGGDEVIDEPPVQTAETPASADETIVAGGETPSSDSSASAESARPARVDPLVGVWVSVHGGEQTSTLVLDVGGDYILAGRDAQGNATRERGTWSRNGATITVSANGERRDYTILLQTTRTLTLDTDTGELLVLKKP